MVNFTRIACALAVAGLGSSQSLGSDAQSHTGLPPSMGSGRPIGTGGPGHGPRPTGFPVGTGVGGHGPRPTNLPSFSGSPPPFPSQSGAAVAAIAAQQSGSAHGSGRPHHSGFAIGTGGGHGHGARPTVRPSGAPPALPSGASFGGPAPSGIARRQESASPPSGPEPTGSKPEFGPTGGRPSFFPTGARPTNLPIPSGAPTGLGGFHFRPSGKPAGVRPSGRPVPSGTWKPTQVPSGVPTGIAPSGFVTKRRA